VSLFFSKILIRVYHTRKKYISHRNFILLASFIVGLVTAIAAVMLKLLISFLEHQANRINQWMNSNWLTAILPLIGIIGSFLILKRMFRGKLQRGVPPVIRSIFQKNSRIDKIHTFGHLLTSAVTVSFGGSAGLEAPIVATGAAIGSNTGKDLRLHQREIMLLLACGTASGISAIFNAPIAGIIFTLEVLLMDFTIPFFIPLLISTATASVISQLLYPQKFFFLITQDWAFSSIPFYVLLGLFCGLISVYTVRTTEQIEGAFERLKLSWKSVFLGGSLLCLLIFFFPPLYGEGYFAVTQLLKGNSDYLMQHAFYHNLSSFKLSVVLVAFLIMMLKPMATALTLGAGGNGGIFASSLVIGGFAGFIFSYTINLTGWFLLPSHHFIIAGMAGMLAGVIHAPLTSIFLIAEITGGYMLFIPLMLVCAIAYFFARRFDRYSLYHKSLIKNGIIPERSHFGDDVL
jgi:CIC family chloride channel protein